MNPHANIVQRDRNNATALAKAIVASAGTPIYNSCDAGALRIQIAAAILDSVTAARAEAAAEIERLRTRVAAWEAEGRAWRTALQARSIIENDLTIDTEEQRLARDGPRDELDAARANTDAVMKAQEKQQ